MHDGAWIKAELFQRWWVPKSFGLTLLSCDLDVRVGGTYRLVFRHPAAPAPMAFHGNFLEETPPSRLVWPNKEAGGNGQVTAVTFEERGGQDFRDERGALRHGRALRKRCAQAAHRFGTAIRLNR